MLPFSRLWYGERNAIGYAKFCSRSHDAVIRVFDLAGNVIETHEHEGEFKEWRVHFFIASGVSSFGNIVRLHRNIPQMSR
jgi:hypothetical protein